MQRVWRKGTHNKHLSLEIPLGAKNISQQRVFNLHFFCKQAPMCDKMWASIPYFVYKAMARQQSHLSYLPRTSGRKAGKHHRRDHKEHHGRSFQFKQRRIFSNLSK